jgi:hypothetical protein
MRRTMLSSLTAAVVGLALSATTILPIATSAEELTSTRSQRPCAAKKPQKLRSAAPPSQGRENRRVLMGWPPKWKPLPGHGY